MTQPLVTIVLPTYNRANRLPGAITSCLNQTHSNFELIVVDDGSTDETPTVVAEFTQRDPRVRYARQANQRLPAALNTGFAISQGAYLTWTSDDNRFHPDALEIMVSALASRPEVGLVYCGYVAVDGSGKFLYRSTGCDPERLLEANCVGACFMYRREVYNAVGGYDPKWLLVEDYEYWLRIQQKFRIFRISDVTPYDYAWHSESLTSKRLLNQSLAALRLRLHYAPSWRSKLLVLRSDSGVVSESAAAERKWICTIFFAALFVLGEPWRRWKWKTSIERIYRAFTVANVKKEVGPRES